MLSTPIKSFYDSSLLNQEAKAISVEKSLYLESMMLPQIQSELEKLRITQRNLFVTNYLEKA